MSIDIAYKDIYKYDSKVVYNHVCVNELMCECVRERECTHKNLVSTYTTPSAP